MDSFFSGNSALRSGSGSHSLEQPSTLKEKHTHETRQSDPILELENAFHDKLLVKDEDSETSGFPDEDGSIGLRDENAKGPEPQREDCDGFSRSICMATTRKLISAMKGSREKEGLPQKKLTVSWAPDVYDPPPTSVSHYPKKRPYQQYSKSYKRHGKGKQKSKNVRGGGSSPKEKKHYRKTGGKSDLSLEYFANATRFDNYKPSMELLDYNDPGIGSHDPNCGSKFLGQASGTTHCVY